MPEIVFKWLWPCIFTLQGFTLTLSRSHLSEPRFINNHIRFKKCPWNSKFSRVGIWNQKDQQVKWLELINQTYQQNKQWNNLSARVHVTPQPKIIFQKLLLVECKLFWWTVTYQHERWINSSYEALISECEYCSILVDDLVDSKRWLADAENVTTTLFPHPLLINCQLSFSKGSLQLRCGATEVISPHLLNYKLVFFYYNFNILKYELFSL